MFAALSRLVTGPRARWVVCAAWLVLAVALVPAGASVDEETKNETPLPVGAESGEVARLLNDRFRSGETAVALLVYRARGDEPLSAAQRRRIAVDAELTKELPLIVGRDVIAPFGPDAGEGQVSADGRIAFTVAPVTTTDRKLIPDTIAELRALGSAPGLDFWVTGPSALEADYATSLESADLVLLVVSALLILGLLLFIYRSPVMAFLPLIVVGVAYAIAIGLLTLFAREGLRIDSTSTSLLLVLMFGAGTDYCLLFVSRYAQALRTNEEPRQALAETIPLTGPAILASGVTVALALMAMLAADLQVTQTLGPVNAVGILIGLAASLTLLPAMLAALGRRAFWPVQHRVAFVPRSSRETVLGRPIDAPRSESYLRAEGRWARIGRAVTLRPRRPLAVSVAALVLCCAGLAAYNGMTNPVDLLRGDQSSVRGYDVLAETFPPGVLAPTTIMLERRERSVRPGDLGVARSAIQSVGGSFEVEDSVERSLDGRLATFAVAFTDDPYGEAAFDRIERYRTVLADLDRPGLTARVGDSTAQQVDYVEGAGRDNKVVIPLALLVIALVLAVLLRSLVAPLFLIATVVLSFAATMGVSLAFFRLLGQDAIDPAVPTFIFIFLVALGVDYNIFLMTRVREEALRYGTREGLSRALGATGPVITSAGVLLASTFAVLMTIPVVPLFQIGFAVALGVLLDTFVVRTVLVPAIASLLGERTWLPWRLRPEAGRVALSGVPQTANAPAETRRTR
jgi:RND superfamily putative drug exporter